MADTPPAHLTLLPPHYDSPEAVRRAYAALEDEAHHYSHEEVLVRLVQLRDAAIHLRMDRALVRELRGQVDSQTLVVADARLPREDEDDAGLPGAAEALVASLDDTGKDSANLLTRRLYTLKQLALRQYADAARAEDPDLAARLSALVDILGGLILGVERGDAAAEADALRYLRAAAPPT